MIQIPVTLLVLAAVIFITVVLLLVCSVLATWDAQSLLEQTGKLHRELEEKVRRLEVCNDALTAVDKGLVEINKELETHNDELKKQLTATAEALRQLTTKIVSR